jgi:hypothetical protein
MNALEYILRISNEKIVEILRTVGKYAKQVSMDGGEATEMRVAALRVDDQQPLKSGEVTWVYCGLVGEDDVRRLADNAADFDRLGLIDADGKPLKHAGVDHIVSNVFDFKKPEEPADDEIKIKFVIVAGEVKIPLPRREAVDPMEELLRQVFECQSVRDMFGAWATDIKR